MKRILSLLILLVLLLAVPAAFAGCSGLSPVETSEMESMIEDMLGYISAGEQEKAYSMMFPGTVTEEEYSENFNTARESFLIPETHTMTVKTYRSNVGVGVGWARVFAGTYSIKAADQLFRVEVEWKETDSGRGFMSFCIMREIDLAFKD